MEIKYNPEFKPETFKKYNGCMADNSEIFFPNRL
jgi:hypothetical protein